MAVSLVPKVLIVDDTPANLVFLRALLSRVDVEVVQAKSGLVALDLAKEHDFAVFLLDVNMPDMDGYELAQKLLSINSNDMVPIVFITADMSQDHDRSKGYESGAIDYIQKPIKETEFISKINILLKIWLKSQQLEIALQKIEEKNLELQTETAKLIEMQSKLDKMAMYDDLTNLPNRSLLKRESKKILAAAERYKHEVGIMFVDLDGFKAVNDNNDHKVGDSVLVEVANRLESVIRDEDFVGRYGGDEFIIFLPNCSTNDIEEVAKRIINENQKPFEMVTIKEKVGVSIGISIFPNHGSTYDELIGIADKMMYRSKQAGKNCYTIYSKTT